MKKILILASIFAICSFSVNAQELHENVAPKKQQPVFAQIPPAVVINNSNVVNNGTGVIGNQPRVRTRTIYRDRLVSITNNNFYYDTTNKVKEAPLVQPEKNDSKDRVIWWNYHNTSLIGTAILIFALLGLLMLLGYWLSSMYRKNNPITPAKPPAATPPTITIVNPQQPDPKPFVVKDEEVKQAMEKAEKSGCTFVRYGNGGYRIDFPKPPAPAAEVKKED